MVFVQMKISIFVLCVNIFLLKKFCQASQEERSVLPAWQELWELPFYVWDCQVRADERRKKSRMLFLLYLYGVILPEERCAG